MSESDDDGWKECSAWLERCGMITGEQSDSLTSVEYLVSILKDGVILCNLCNRLKQDSIPPRSVSQKPQNSPEAETFSITSYWMTILDQLKKFLCNKNIKAFLSACKSSFHLKDSHLFNPADLMEFSNFGKVVFTLSKLSFTKEAKNCKIEPFSAEDDADYVIMKNVIEDVEDEYSSSLYGINLDRFGNDDNSEDIYDSLVTKKLYDSSFATCSLKSKKDMCIEELVSTEKNFIDVLNLVNTVFIQQLRNHLSPQEHATIFLMFESLKKTHSDLHSKLLATASMSHPAIGIANVFVDNFMSLVIYGDYCSKVEKANMELQRVCQAKPQVKAIVERGALTAKVKLHDLLTVPIQRVLKYHLIIKELSKHCQDNQEEAAALKKALDVVEDLSLYINEVKRDTENIEATKEIQKSIVDIEKFSSSTSSLALVDYGRRHFDEEFKVKEMSSRFYKTRYIFLFDKLLLICKPIRNGDQYKYRASLALRTISIKSCSRERGLSDLILGDEDDPGHKYFVSAKQQLVEKLLSYIEMAKSNCCPDGQNVGGHNFVLTNFDQALSCSVCKKLLRGKISQGYKCKYSHMVAHKECLLKAANQPNENANPVSPPLPPIGPRKRSVVLPPTPFQRPRESINVIDSANPQDHPWFAKVNCRAEASNLLRNYPDGTFLVRWSDEKQNYVISMKFDTVRHMVINKNNSHTYFLKQPFIFNSVPVLIEHYKTNSLKEAYPNILCCLNQSYSEASKVGPTRCRALYDFCATEAKQLTFQAGDIIEIIDRRENQSFWKGILGKKKGYFPSNYVEEISD